MTVLRMGLKVLYYNPFTACNINGYHLSIHHNGGLRLIKHADYCVLTFLDTGLDVAQVAYSLIQCVLCTVV